MRSTVTTRLAAAAVIATATVASAHADEPAPPTAAVPAAPAAAAPAAPAPAPDASAAAAPTGLQLGYGISLNAQIEGGISIDPLGQHGSNENFGQLFTDHNNQFQLNQILLTLHRDLDPKDTGYQWGFRIQGLYGSDARYTHFLGELDTTIGQRYQLTILEADILAHLPWLSDGGIDLKVGQYPTPLGYETIDPSTNPFYSHSYIFNFGLPFLHTGALAVWHANPTVDVYLGVDTGNQTTFGNYAGDNNGAPAGIIGFALNNLLDGKLSLIALDHMGPENSSRVVPNASGYMRFYNDIVATYKATDKLTLVTEGNWVHDAFGAAGTGADAGGVAQYASYTLSDTLTLNARAEIFRDDKGFFVAEYPGNLDDINSIAGLPNGAIGVGPGTYTEFTLGVTWKPSGLPAPIAGIIIRPEVRYDRNLVNTNVYQGFSDRNSLTLASDIILQF